MQAWVRSPGCREPRPGSALGGGLIPSALPDFGDEGLQGQASLPPVPRAVGSSRRRHFALGSGRGIEPLIFIFPF